MPQKVSHTWCKPLRWLLVLQIVLSLFFPSQALAAGCQTGVEALANVYLRFNPIFAYYFGSMESYINQNRAHFATGGDSIVCARRLSQAWSQGAFKNYDPQDRVRRDRISTELGTLGISPGQSTSSPATNLYFASLQMAKFADTLPYAANGNYGPLYQPRNEVEQMQLFAMQMFPVLLQDPSMVAVLEQIRPQAIELGNIEYRLIVDSSRGM